MPKWDFKTVMVTGGKAEFVPLTDEQRERIDFYQEALERAAESNVANPPFSNYFVKESIGVPGIKMSAGNIEYGWCQAIHGEESAVAAFRSIFSRDEKIDDPLVLGIIAGNPEQIANPCGNCRDIMLEDLREDFEIVSGAPEGGVAVVVKMSDYLFDQPTPSDLKQHAMHHDWLENKLHFALNGCKELGNDAYSPKNIHPERNYFAALIMPNMATGRNEDTRYFGAHDVMCEYHPIYALRDAIRQARRANDVSLREVVIVGASTKPGVPPHVMYKDRQHLMEYNLQCELVSGENQNPPVYLLTYDHALWKAEDQLKLVGAWTTSVKEWLPFPFSPRNFGDEFIKHLTEYYKKKS